MSKIQKIVIGSFYSKPASKKKQVFLDHISDVFHMMSSKFTNGLYFLICGDSNCLRLDPILNLSAQLKQIVDKPTRGNAILDPVITDLHPFYQKPLIEAPLQSDTENGEDSDHKIVLVKPLNNIENKIVIDKKTVEVRNYSEKNFASMDTALGEVDWAFLSQCLSVDIKMKQFQDSLFNIFETSFPPKKKTLLSRNEPYYNDVLLKLKRKKSREYTKHRRSQKYLDLNKLYNEMLLKAKKKFYRGKVSHLKKSNPRGWHRNLKMLLRVDNRNDIPEVDNIKHLTDFEQAEAIADSFAKISNEYRPIDKSKLILPELSAADILRISNEEVLKVLRSLKVNKSAPEGDIPARIYKRFSEKLCGPIASLINDCIEQGSWPDFLKMETVTPVPKIKTPQTPDDVRKIACLLNLNKILERVICEHLVEDLTKTLDTSQFANQKGQSMNHYLIMMIDKVLRSLDGASKGEAAAALVTLLDFSKAFDRQDATLAVKSFQDNGVRPSLIPLLISFFEGRKMTVKWHGVKSGLRSLPGGSPQGASLGLWSFLSQTNDNPEDACSDEIYKFVDDKSGIEIINLFSIGLASHNTKATVPSNIPISNNFMPRKHLKTQSNMERVVKWSESKQMKLNTKKTKNICFNFTRDKQFSTDIKLNNESIETVSETKLLGTIISDDLK